MKNFNLLIFILFSVILLSCSGVSKIRRTLIRSWTVDKMLISDENVLYDYYFSNSLDFKSNELVKLPPTRDIGTGYDIIEANWNIEKKGDKYIVKFTNTFQEWMKDPFEVKFSSTGTLYLISDTITFECSRLFD